MIRHLKILFVKTIQGFFLWPLTLFMGHLKFISAFTIILYMTALKLYFYNRNCITSKHKNWSHYRRRSHWKVTSRYFHKFVLLCLLWKYKCLISAKCRNAFDINVLYTYNMSFDNEITIRAYVGIYHGRHLGSGGLSMGWVKNN